LLGWLADSYAAEYGHNEILRYETLPLASLLRHGVITIEYGSHNYVTTGGYIVVLSRSVTVVFVIRDIAASRHERCRLLKNTATPERQVIITLFGHTSVIVG